MKTQLDRKGVFVFEDNSTLSTGPHPFYGDSAFRKRHNIYDKHGRWIGDDLRSTEDPHRVITSGVEHALYGESIINCYRKYQLGDYGRGEAGFASYLVWDKEGDPITVWLIDDAVRSPEGEPPARDANTSPGPQTLLLPEEY